MKFLIVECLFVAATSILALGINPFASRWKNLCLFTLISMFFFMGNILYIQALYRDNI